MLTLKCRACNNPVHNNEWVESIKDYNDLCSTCLDAIGLNIELDAASLFKQANDILYKDNEDQADTDESNGEGGEGDGAA